ncbi:hypothetical protein [Vandammella animalimorsus]|uniref:hypothetical protein n=1 Tax=Vandammella animalimorsus TaxID=2029117 RepID=UPI0011785EEA|nr:hypothetical protein [Vandammella animalimorsus]
MNVERVVGIGPLKIKYRITAHVDFLYGNICFVYDGVEIGDYDDVVNLNDVHGWLNDFSKKKGQRVIGFLEGESKEVLINFVYFQIMTFITPEGECDSYESPSSSTLYRMGEIFHLDDNLSYSFLDKFFGILFDDFSMKKQRFIWGAWKDRVPHEILLDIGYFEGLISEFSSSLMETRPYIIYKKNNFDKRYRRRSGVIEDIVGAGCLKMKYKIFKENSPIGNFCIKNKDVEIGNYRESVNLMELGEKLNEFSKNKNKRFIGFLDGDSSVGIFNAIYMQIFGSKNGGEIMELSSSLACRVREVFCLSECFSSNYFRRCPVILFNDGLIKKQRLICFNQEDGLLHEFLLEQDYFEDLVRDFLRSLHESLKC